MPASIGTPIPERQSGSERRRHARAPIHFIVQYRTDTFEAFMAEYATNVSESGMFIRTQDPRPVGELIYFQFLLSDGDRVIEGLGRVVWSGETDAPPLGPDGDGRKGMGVEFVNLDEESAATIRRIVAQRLWG